MSLKKKNFSEDEIALFDNVVLYKRGEFWQMRMWLAHEHKYARFSLKTRNINTAKDKAEERYYELKVLEKQKKPYFSITTKDGVEKYIASRAIDVEDGNIVKGRLSTIKTHLEHWLNFVKKDTKLKDLDRMECYEYSSKRLKTKKGLGASQTTIKNEQSTINAMMSWLYKNKLTDINGFEFKKMKAVDRGDEANRRNTFEKDEVKAIHRVLKKYILQSFKKIDGEGSVVNILGGCYIGFSIVSGLRRGEQLQLTWADVNDTEHELGRDNKYDLAKIKVRGDTSKVGKTRVFVVKDPFYLTYMMRLRRLLDNSGDPNYHKKIQSDLVFSLDGKKQITPRAIGYQFDKILELAGVDRDDRKLVPYSCRHYFITDKVNSNVPITAIAEMCGTSITEIERTYYHTSVNKMISNAVAGYDYINGVLTPVAVDTDDF